MKPSSQVIFKVVEGTHTYVQGTNSINASIMTNETVQKVTSMIVQYVLDLKYNFISDRRVRKKGLSFSIRNDDEK